jgi:PAS domain-containing protein
MTQQQASDFGWQGVLHPMRGVDGKYHAILAQGLPIRDENGKIQRWADINLDISRLKNTERALRSVPDRDR